MSFLTCAAPPRGLATEGGLSSSESDVVRCGSALGTGDKELEDADSALES